MSSLARAGALLMRFCLFIGRKGDVSFLIYRFYGYLSNIRLIANFDSLRDVLDDEKYANNAPTIHIYAE